MNIEYKKIVEVQRSFFESGVTLPYAFRKDNLQNLLNVITINEKKILDALWEDIHVNAFEAWGLQVGLLQYEIKHALKNLHIWMRSKKISTPLFHLRSNNYIHYQPYGSTLIIGPWNFPFMLALRPAVGAMAAGNTCVIKPSEITVHTAELMGELINTQFPEAYLKVINTDANGTRELLEEKFDFIFFTGGTKVGQIVYEAAAKNLTPVALELGGKSPCIVDSEINLHIAAKRISWGKFLNAGQICVTPDYCLVHRKIKDEFISEIIKNIKNSFGTDAQQSNDYGRIVNNTHALRIQKLLEGTTILYGGKFDIHDKYMEPTLVEITDLHSPIMHEEIFGPILPIITYDTVETVFDILKMNPDPLVLYIYSKNEELINKIKVEVKSGDMCVNENVLHFGQVFMPIGGIGKSGIGKYQGANSFYEFSHKKSVMHKKYFPDLAFRYPPYNKNKLNQLKFFFKYFWD